MDQGKGACRGNHNAEREQQSQADHTGCCDAALLSQPHGNAIAYQQSTKTPKIPYVLLQEFQPQQNDPPPVLA
jgi:hypothetical protein